MQDVIEKAEEEELMRQYTVSKGTDSREHKSKQPRGFVVSGAPWSTSSTDDFPTLGGGGGGKGGASTGVGGARAGGTTKKAQWGPSAFGPRLPRSNN